MEKGWDEIRRVLQYQPTFQSRYLIHQPLVSRWRSLSHNGVMDYLRYQISEMHLGKFPNPSEFQSWTVNFKTEVCAKSAFLHITTHWIKEVEIAKSIDYLMTSQSITGRRDFSDYEMLDAKIASALEKPSHKRAFPKKSKCRRATCSERRPIFTRTADCLHDLWAFSGQRSSRCSSWPIRSVQCFLTKTWNSRFRYRIDSASQYDAHLTFFGDNEAVIKMITKGRSPTMRHVTRTHRVALDWLFHRVNLDYKIQI